MSRRDPTLSLSLFSVDAVKMTDAEKLTAIRSRVERAVLSRIGRCKRHAAELAADMEVVAQRLVRDGRHADIGSVKVAAYHIAQTELEVLKRALAMIDSVFAGKDHEVDPPSDELLED